MTAPAVRVARTDIDPDCWAVTTAQAAHRTGRSPVTIRSWAHRRLIHPIGWIGRTPLYDLADVMRVERDTYQTMTGGSLRLVCPDATITANGEAMPAGQDHA